MATTYVVLSDPVDAPSFAYKPRGAAIDAWTARDFELMVSGPAETGKTRVCLEKIERASLEVPRG